VSVCVRFSGVAKSFPPGDPQGLVLRDVDLALPRASTTAIVGESGSGKTTLLQLVNGVLRPDAGAVEVFGAPVPKNDLVRHRRRIGYAVQGSGLFPHLTIEGNVTLLARLEGWPAERVAARFADLMAQMNLPLALAERYPVALSGGQQQRVGLARALMLEPELLLLDEAFSAVDPITRSDIYDSFLAAQRRSGVSAVLVTHDLREAVRLADYLVVLREGRVLQAAPPRQVLDAPAEDYVARLLETQL